MSSIQEIKTVLQHASYEELPACIKQFENDDRTGVMKEVARAQKRLSQWKAEIERIENMKQFEYQYWNEYDYVCGIDEVGRGPLAGPVMAAAVIFPKDVNLLYLNDSKQLSEKKREELYEEIKEKAIAYAVGIADVATIDEINILQADYVAMRQAISRLSVTPQILLNDAVTIPSVNQPQVPIIKGDTKSISIAAASIVAKVERDHLMCVYDEIYPEYGFARNKGYGSAEHIEAIRKYGPCDIHRRSFIKNFI
ncbi:MAG: ribonuclease HII [Lachnospiraceae bacterium]|nr:ribonuclease HII [Lachnospiraceae bacterium]